jgi:hypothetical protein
MPKSIIEQLTEKQKTEVRALMAREDITDFNEGTHRYLVEKRLIKGA